MKRLGWIICSGALVAVIGCTNMTPEQQGTVSGAALGMAGGAGIAAIAGGDAWTGALIGGAAGAVAGNIQGANARRGRRW